MTFFVPCLIGKAINKTTIQVIFLVVAFSKNMMTSVLSWIGWVAPSIAMQIGQSIDKTKTTLFKTQAELDAQEENEPFIKKLWEMCMTLMILYFVVTFLNALIRN